METAVLVFLLFILVLSIFLGLEAVSKVPASLHTPFLSGSTAISSITVLSAVLAAGLATGGRNDFAAILGGCATALATACAVGAFLLTDKMLKK